MNEHTARIFSSNFTRDSRLRFSGFAVHLRGSVSRLLCRDFREFPAGLLMRNRVRHSDCFHVSLGKRAPLSGCAEI